MPKKCFISLTIGRHVGSKDEERTKEVSLWKWREICFIWVLRSLGFLLNFNFRAYFTLSASFSSGKSGRYGFVWFYTHSLQKNSIAFIFWLKTSTCWIMGWSFCQRFLTFIFKGLVKLKAHLHKFPFAHSFRLWLMFHNSRYWSLWSIHNSRSAFFLTLHPFSIHLELS